MLQLLLDDDGIDAALQKDLAQAQWVNRCIDESEDLSREQRLDIYAQGYFLRLEECFRADYPRLAAAVGESRFRVLVMSFMAQSPSISPTLSDANEGFEDFCRQHPYVQELPYIGDLCAMESAVCVSFWADDEPCLAAIDLRAEDMEHLESLRFICHPSLVLLDLSWSVDELWNSSLDDARGSQARAGLSERPTPLMLWRNHDIVHMEVLSPNAFATLRALSLGTPLGLVAERAQTFGAKEGEAFGTWFATWLSSGVFTSICLS